jgi:IS30 family transposase
MQNIPHIPWSDEERDTLRRLRENGVSVRQCAEMLGRSFHSVQRAIRRVGIQRSVREPQQPRVQPPRRVGLVSLPPLPSLRHD